MNKEDTYHFYTSEKHKALKLTYDEITNVPHRYRNYAVIDGVEVEFDAAYPTIDNAYSWKDKVYLGKGTYSRCEVIK